jgi:hypothetical protein
VVAAAASLLPFVIVMGTLSRAAGAVADRIGPRLPRTSGPLVAAAGAASAALYVESNRRRAR